MIGIKLEKDGMVIKDINAVYSLGAPIFSLHNFKHLRDRSLIIGFVGARGSGKSVGGARTAILDHMLEGRQVWSNMEISINLANGNGGHIIKSNDIDRLELKELDEVYENGLIFLDEINMYLADSRRAMSSGNVMFSYILQQLRKRQLNIIWTAQHEMHIDSRLRFQTDVFIICKDISLDPEHRNCGIGELSEWTAYDMSGIVSGHTPASNAEALFYKGIVWNKPWWNSYSTFQLQGVDGGDSNGLTETERKARELAEKINQMFLDGVEVLNKREVRKQFEINNRSLQIKLGEILANEYGIIKNYNNTTWTKLEEEMVEA